MPPSNADILSSPMPDRHFESLHGLETGYWWFVGRLAWAERLIRRYHPGKIEAYADIGCGTGGFAREMKARLSIARVALVDAHPEALKHLAQESGVSILACDITKNFSLPVTPTLITLMDVIEHIEDDQALLAHVAGQLAPGGTLLVTVLAHAFLFSEWDRLLGHHRRYSLGELKKKVSATGLKVREARYMWSFLFPAAPWRKLRPAQQTKLEFPPVAPWMNRLLVFFSGVEWLVSRFIPAPFGTSIILIAEKP